MNELSVSITEKNIIEVLMEINKLIKIEILLETTNLLPIKSVFYRFSVGALEQKTGENGDGSPVI